MSRRHRNTERYKLAIYFIAPIALALALMAYRSLYEKPKYKLPRMESFPEIQFLPETQEELKSQSSKKMKK